LFESVLHIDQEILIYLNNLGSKQWDPFWMAITNQFNWIPLFLLVIFLVIKTYGWKRGGFLILSMIFLVAFSDQFTNLIKNTTQRLRPNNDPTINHLLRTIYSPKGFSFMSGHATTSTFFTIYILLLLKNNFKKYIFFLLLFPLVFSYSRLYLGVHFPLDVLTGLSIGFLFATLYYKVIGFIFKKIFGSFLK
jgi:undecaprenyl-diphosphatase